MFESKDEKIQKLIKKIRILKENEIILEEQLKIADKKEIIARKNNFKLKKEIEKLQNQIQKLEKKEKNKMVLITIYDRKAEKHGNVYTEVNTAVAIRGFAEACQNPKSPMAMFASDMELCLVGEYDERTGIIVPKQPTVLAKATDYVAKKEVEK